MLKSDEIVENSIQLFSLPDIYFELRKVLDDANSSLQDIVSVIKNDPAMTMRLLRLANSPFFGFASKIDTLDRAINLLGAKQVHDLALSAYVIDASTSIEIDEALLEQFWYDSVRTGIAARMIAKHCHLLDTERLFVAGLLHNVGHLLMYSQIPEEAEHVANLASRQGKDLYLMEKTMLGYDYAHIGAYLMREWGLPESLQMITANHVSPESTELYLLESAIVNVAKNIVGNDDVLSILEKMSEATLSITGMNDELLKSVSEDSVRQTDEVISLMMPTSKAS